jgi:type I restriction enzyme, S subunit
LAEDGGFFDEPNRGIAYQITGKSWVNNHAHVLRPKSDRIDISYLCRVLQNYDVSPFISGTTRSKLTKGQAEKIPIPLPPLDEQRRIAAILDKADALCRKRKRTLELLQSASPSIFFEMFGNLVESRIYPRGTVSDWVADFDTGKNLAPDPNPNEKGGYRVLKVSAVTKGTFDPNEAKPMPKNYKPPISHFVKKGDLLFSRANTVELIGATAFVEHAYERLVLPDKIWRFIWRSSNAPHPRFIHTLFSTPAFRREISKRATGTSGSMKNISKSKVLGIEIALPDRCKQERFVNRQDVARRSMFVAVKQLSLLEDQFSSLQHRAFSGQL